jgi:hypothetical protein
MTQPSSTLSLMLGAKAVRISRHCLFEEMSRNMPLKQTKPIEQPTLPSCLCFQVGGFSSQCSAQPNADNGCPTRYHPPPAIGNATQNRTIQWRKEQRRSCSRRMPSNTTRRIKTFQIVVSCLRYRSRPRSKAPERALKHILQQHQVHSTKE